MVTKIGSLQERNIQVIDWDAPPRATATNILFQVFSSTAGQIVRPPIDVSGDPPISEVREWYYGEDEQEPSMPSSSTNFWCLCKPRDEHGAEHHRYWESTKARTRSGRPVDGVIMPIAPSACVEERAFGYYGEPAFKHHLSSHNFSHSFSSDREFQLLPCLSIASFACSLLSHCDFFFFFDYMAGTFPVIFADKGKDLEDPRYKPLNEANRVNWRSCKSRYNIPR
ncbi:hypothetical protein B0J12DRAFT_703976 [Macrophomina phaseolina]|uniref:Uncharacterized protein n=1 Tax=Macrophomina phaseolina TaxID=35725 RepID=A0ABQ8FXF9_9PEZI|nr:hypothetical protein B0J12DRAFT_703976 [Macrophomina phaseolina]